MVSCVASVNQFLRLPFHFISFNFSFHFIFFVHGNPVGNGHFSGGRNKIYNLNLQVKNLQTKINNLIAKRK